MCVAGPSVSIHSRRAESFENVPVRAVRKERVRLGCRTRVVEGSTVVSRPSRWCGRALVRVTTEIVESGVGAFRTTLLFEGPSCGCLDRARVVLSACRRRPPASWAEVYGRPTVSPSRTGWHGPGEGVRSTPK